MLRKFCCMTVRTATLVFGWLGCVFSSLLAFLCLVALALRDDLAKYIYDNLGPDDDPDLNTDRIGAWIIIICVVLLISCAMNFIASALLITGTNKKRPALLLPWLILSGVSIVLSLIQFFFLILAMISSGRSSGLSLNGLSLALSIYMWQAVFSHYKELKEDQRQQERGINYAMLQK